MRKKVLIVMPAAFRYGWMGATQRIFQISHALKSLGYEVALFAAASTNPDVQKMIDDVYPGLVFRTKHTGAYPRYLDFSDFLRRFCRILWRIRGLNCYFGKVSFGWAKSLELGNVEGVLKSSNFIPSLVWGVSTGYLDGPTLANDVAKKLGIPWVMEIQDPPQGAGIGPNQSVVWAQYESLIADADKIIVTSNSYAKRLYESFNPKEKSVSAIHLTYDGNIFETFETNLQPPIKFLYAGLLGSGRSLRGFVEGVHAAVVADPNLLKLIHVDLIGDGDGFDDVESMVKDRNISDLFQFHGQRNKEYCDKYCEQANVLIVMQTIETSKMQIPGKIFNYLKYLKPVLGLMPDCEAAEILLKSGLGLVHVESDTNGLANTLKNLCLQDGSYLTSLSPNTRFIEEFSFVALCGKLKTIIDDVM